MAEPTEISTTQRTGGSLIVGTDRPSIREEEHRTFSREELAEIERGLALVVNLEAIKQALEDESYSHWQETLASLAKSGPMKLEVYKALEGLVKVFELTDYPDVQLFASFVRDVFEDFRSRLNKAGLEPERLTSIYIESESLNITYDELNMNKVIEDDVKQNREHAKTREAGGGLSELHAPPGGRPSTATPPAYPGADSIGAAQAVKQIKNLAESKLREVSEEIGPILRNLVSQFLNVKNLDSYEENHSCTELISKMCSMSGAFLVYRGDKTNYIGSKVDLDCVHRPDYPTGGFRLRTTDSETGKRVHISTTKELPPVELEGLPLNSAG